MQIRWPLPAMTFCQLGTTHRLEPTVSAFGSERPGLIFRISSSDIPKRRVIAIAVSPLFTTIECA